MVAFVAGGMDSQNNAGNGKIAELYSPNGKCSYQLASVPSTSDQYKFPVLGILDNNILACDNQFHNFQKCWSYNIGNNTWSLYTESQFAHSNPGITYKGKLYILDMLQPEVFDPVTKTWSSWPAVLEDPYGGCIVGFENLVIVNCCLND